MSGRGTLLTVLLLAIGGASLSMTVSEGRYEPAARVLFGLALVVTGYVLRAAETLGFLPDVLVRDVDDEAAVASLCGIAAQFAGGVVLLLPATGLLDSKSQWATSLFALLVGVLLMIHLLTSGLED